MNRARGATKARMNKKMEKKVRGLDAVDLQ